MLTKFQLHKFQILLLVIFFEEIFNANYRNRKSKNFLFKIYFMKCIANIEHMLGSKFDSNLAYEHRNYFRMPPFLVWFIIFYGSWAKLIEEVWAQSHTIVGHINCVERKTRSGIELRCMKWKNEMRRKRSEIMFWDKYYALR